MSHVLSQFEAGVRRFCQNAGIFGTDGLVPYIGTWVWHMSVIPGKIRWYLGLVM